MLSLPTLAHPLRNASESPATKPMRHAIVSPHAMATELLLTILGPCERSLADPLRAVDLNQQTNDRQRQHGCRPDDCGQQLPKILSSIGQRRLVLLLARVPVKYDRFTVVDPRPVIARLGRATVRSRARSVQGGASPLQVNLLRPVSNRNCVAVRRGGEQRKVTEPSVAKANSIRPR